MKKYFLSFFILIIFQIHAQQDSRVITTAVPFVTVASDARAAALGDMGVATSVDAYSQYWNPSKYIRTPYKMGVALSYTPYLSQLVNDIKIINLTYYNKINDRSAAGASIKYFGLGEIQLTDANGVATTTVNPNEFYIDASYALKLSETYSMAVSLRFINSDLKLGTGNDDATAAKDFSVDISGFYQSDPIDFKDFEGVIRLGYNIQNLGPKMKYYKSDEGDFLPTNLKLGAGFDFIMDEYNTVGVTFETNKLLVPTPPIRDNNGQIISGKDDNVNWMTGIFQSFGDAPGGFSEELKEFQWSLGTEYNYLDVFALRAGYFHESKIKGDRKFFSIGAGFKYNYMVLDFSYLFTTGALTGALDKTMRFSLSFNLDEIGTTSEGTKQE